jgi:hypothetical protein
LEIGLAALGFSIIAFWLWRIPSAPKLVGPYNRLLVFSYAGIIILLFLSTGASTALWQLSHADRLLSYPWQILLLTAPLLAVTAGSLPVLHSGFERTTYWLVLISLTVLGSYPYLNAEFTQVIPPEQPLAVVGFENNLVLLDMDFDENRETSEARLDITWQVLRPLPFDYNIFLQALTEDGNSLNVVAQLDRQPLAGEHPPTAWQMGEILSDSYRLDLSTTPSFADQHATGLRYFFGFYDWRDGTRLPINGGIDDKLVFYGE